MRNFGHRFFITVSVIFAALLLSTAAFAAPRPVYMVTIDGAIEPSTADYVVRGLNEAQDADAAAFLIKMDTPGGLMDAMRKIVRAELGSRVPVIVYVAPNGARAGSAGVFITMAANIAAMAPVSNIGSAHPVAIGLTGMPTQPDKTMETKIENDAAKYAISIAERRGRNAQWAEQAVLKSVNLTAREAKKENVINYVSENVPELLTQINGTKVSVGGTTVVLRTARAPVRQVPMNAKEVFLHFLANPNVAAVLLMFSIFGIIAELSNPGSIFPGVVGGISLVLFLYSYSILPLNAAGLALVVFAIVLFIADIKVPSHGVLTFGGILSLALGLFLLFNTGSPAFRVSIQLIGALVIVTSGFFVFVVQTGLRALRRPVVTGREGMVGLVVEAKTDISGSGKVFADGTWWTAESDETIKKGDKVQIVSVEGLKLRVRRA